MSCIIDFFICIFFIFSLFIGIIIIHDSCLKFLGYSRDDLMKPLLCTVKNNDFIGQSHVGVLFLALDFVTSHTPLKTNITAMAWVNFNTPTPITSEAKTETMG